MFQQILVPLDGSTRAERAILVAAHIAHTTGGSIVLLRGAALPSEYEPPLYAAYPSRAPFFAQHMLEEELAKAQAYLTGIAQSEKLAGMRAETAVLAGAAARIILDAAKEKHVDLIVMCHHGETGGKGRALGSVAQNIARQSSVPVLVLPEGSLEPVDLHAGDAHLLRALVALDGSPLAEAALVPAAYLVAVLAGPAQGALHLVQVVKLPTIQK